MIQETPRKAPFMVEPLPANFVARPEEYEAIVEALLDQAKAGLVGITAALRGAGGYGKTVLARAVCHDTRVRAAFPDGVVWVTLGENPGELERVAKIGYLLSRFTGAKEELPDLPTAAARLHEELTGRQALLVVDDVWNGAHLKPFLQGGPRCGCLVTTRNDDTLPAGTRKVNVDAMREQEALRLISAGLGEGNRGEFLKLAVRLGEWPLLLSLANGQLFTAVDLGYSLEQALKKVDQAYDRKGLSAFNAQNPQERNQAADLAIAVSVNNLTQPQKNRFHELAVFPEDVDIPLAAIEALWIYERHMQAEEVEPNLFLLKQRSLLQQFDPAGKTVRLHDVVRKYLVDQWGERVNGLHELLLSAYGKRCPGGWSTGPQDGYFYRWLTHHLAQAGQVDELEQLLMDFDWIDAHLRSGGITELLEDYEVGLRVVKEERGAIGQIRGALRLSAHMLALEADQLAGQLLGRLLEQKGAGIERLLKQAKGWKGRAWLRPVYPCFNPPGSGEVRTLSGHTDFVYAVAISPDGQLVVSGSGDKTLKVWDLATGKELRTLSGHTRFVSAVAISPDGLRAVSGSWDCTLKLWDLSAAVAAVGGAELRTLSGHTQEVNAVAISPDGKLAVSGSTDGTLKVWDLATGARLRTLSGQPFYFSALAISPDGRLVVAGTSGGSLKVWDLNTGRAVRTLSRHTQEVFAVAISPDGQFVVSGSDDDTIKVWDLASGKELHTLRGHIRNVNAVAISPDGRLIVSGSDDDTLKVWDLASGAELHTLNGHSRNVHALAISPDGRFVVSASGDTTLKVWELAASTQAVVLVDQYTGAAIRTPGRHIRNINGVAIHPNGRLAVSASGDNTLKVWDLATGREVRTFVGHTRSVSAVAISPDGQLAVSGSWDNKLKVWELATGKELHTLTGHPQEVTALAISPNGQRVVSGSADSSIKIWDLGAAALAEGRAELYTLTGHMRNVNTIAISPDGQWMVSGADDHTLKVWELGRMGPGAAGPERYTLNGHTGFVTAAAISPDGRLVVSGSGDKTLKVWELATGREVGTLSGHADSIEAAAISPDGQLAVSGSKDSTIKVWDLASGICKASFYCNGPVYACAVTPDSQMIVAGDFSGMMYFLHIEGL